ncbi:MAG: hypothetical protein F2681_15030 [Actinobacteria bacterium]|uniref:Unannotated protein n=1 Tax=freshwater metagenome TaxID=449393 RepID=A0A6J6AB52_9ZZZZ|nr:hypothetical protein [Actinomycetota bacterium]MSW78879.1 hypothetical protein [Actinomycetota bacterium]MSX94644.1 hypothetical protein [Actinomycetota bacterium]MSZ84447.1 hypothetical protein [Actinomycetota bacterium]MTB19439.1 hypothetical protein [Actinomycetota bacterium]
MSGAAVITAWTFANDIGVPVTVALATLVATTLIRQQSEARSRRRDRYAQAVAVLVAWVEYPYRIRRRTSDSPEGLSTLATVGHDLQQELARSRAWVEAEDAVVAEVYRTVVATLGAAIGPACCEAWESPPVATAAGMNLKGWGPGAGCFAAIQGLESAIAERFRWWGFLAPLRRRRCRSSE